MPKSRSTISNLSSFSEIERLKKQNAENTELENEVKVKKPKKFDVEGYKKLKDLPAWYRSLSNAQIAAANSLTEAIRDDIEQGTSHRCQIALCRLGLCPLEPPKNIKFVIKISIGNDLAFLWFLLELFYLDTCAECDHPKTEYNVNQQLLMSAIAHLDMVVTLRALDKIAPRPPKPKPKPKPKRPDVVRPKKKTYLSPLLEPLPRPKIGVRKQRRPLRPVQQLRYAHLWNNPSYIPPNEWNRWYSWPEEKQKNLDFGFDETEGPKAVVSQFLRNYLYSILDESTDMKDIQKPLCAKHLKLHEKEAPNKRIEDVKKREETRKYFSPNERKRVRRKKITKQIEQDAKRIQDERNERVEYLELRTWIKCFIIDLIWNVTTPKKEEKGCALEKACSVEKIQQNQIKKNHQCNCCLTCVNDSFEFGHFGIPKPNEIYFHAPSRNKPYNFDYPKIFNDVEEKKNPIKNAISKALNLNEFANEDEAINSWLKSTWEEEVKKTNEEYKQKEEVTKEPKIINPSEQEMDQILENCFKILKTNAKFVFASMPNAHKHPSVRMWLRDRFGILKVNEEEREEALDRTKRILSKISRQKYTIRPPENEEISKEKFVSYACRDYVYSKTKRALQKFYHEFKMTYLENCRTFWQLMEHRHCSSPPYRVFFAYMPSSEYDIMLVRPWRSNEFMDAAKAFRIRQHKKRMEAKYKL